VSDDVWAYIGGLREDLSRAEERIHELDHRLAALEQAGAARSGADAEISADAFERARRAFPAAAPHALKAALEAAMRSPEKES
jgi:hypothetical protein